MLTRVVKCQKIVRFLFLTKYCLECSTHKMFPLSRLFNAGDNGSAPLLVIGWDQVAGTRLNMSFVS